MGRDAETRAGLLLAAAWSYPEAEGGFRHEGPRGLLRLSGLSWLYPQYVARVVPAAFHWEVAKVWGQGGSDSFAGSETLIQAVEVTLPTPQDGLDYHGQVADRLPQGVVSMDHGGYGCLV
jgi:hypothetical protein